MDEAVQAVAEAARRVVDMAAEQCNALLEIQRGRPLAEHDMQAVVHMIEHAVKDLIAPIQGLVHLRLQSRMDHYEAHSEKYMALMSDPSMTRMASAGCFVATELPLGPAGMPSVLPPASMNPFILNETNVSIALGRQRRADDQDDSASSGSDDDDNNNDDDDEEDGRGRRRRGKKDTSRRRAE